MEQTRRFRADKTRLKNLLILYRNHLITNRLDKYSGKNPSDVVDEIDKSIFIIKKYI